MSIQTVTLLIAILALVCFFGCMYGIQSLVKQGKDPGVQLQSADSFVDTAVEINTGLKSFIPAPVEGIIDLVLKVTQSGVHSAQQLYNSGQLPPDLRKEQATDYAINMIKLTGREITPELEQAIRGTAEAGVFMMKQVDPVVPAPITVINSVPNDTATIQDSVITPVVESQPVIDTVQQPA